MPDIEKILRFIVEQFEDTPMGIMIMFFVMLTSIALVVDTMLTYTFPAFTLIALFLFAGNTGMKIYEKHLIKKKKPWDK